MGRRPWSIGRHFDTGLSALGGGGGGAALRRGLLTQGLHQGGVEQLRLVLAATLRVSVSDHPVDLALGLGQHRQQRGDLTKQHRPSWVRRSGVADRNVGGGKCTCSPEGVAVASASACTAAILMVLLVELTARSSSGALAGRKRGQRVSARAIDQEQAPSTRYSEQTQAQRASSGLWTDRRALASLGQPVHRRPAGAVRPVLANRELKGGAQCYESDALDGSDRVAELRSEPAIRLYANAEERQRRP